jgi:hypothetical protein
MAIPDKVAQKLREQVWKRSSRVGLANAFTELGVPASDPFYEFYSKFHGPFRSDKIGFELLDVIEQDESIVTNTRLVREQLDFPSHYIVLTSMNGLAVLIYNLKNGGVFDVDFEGGDELLLRGELPPRWRNWWDFADNYFC